MAGPSTGHPMKLYYNTGTAAVPVWVEVDEVGDVSIPDMSRGMAELKRRASDFTKNLPTLIQTINVEFRLHHGMNPTVFDTLIADFFAGTVKQWAIMNGDIAVADNEGLTMPAIIESLPWDQPLEDVSGHDVRLASAYWESPAGVEIDPAWLVTT